MVRRRFEEMTKRFYRVSSDPSAAVAHLAALPQPKEKILTEGGTSFVLGEDAALLSTGETAIHLDAIEEAILLDTRETIALLAREIRLKAQTIYLNQRPIKNSVLNNTHSFLYAESTYGPLVLQGAEVIFGVPGEGQYSVPLADIAGSTRLMEDPVEYQEERVLLKHWTALLNTLDQLK